MVKKKTKQQQIEELQKRIKEIEHDNEVLWQRNRDANANIKELESRLHNLQWKEENTEQQNKRLINKLCNVRDILAGNASYSSKAEVLTDLFSKEIEELKQREGDMRYPKSIYSISDTL